MHIILCVCFISKLKQILNLELIFGTLEKSHELKAHFLHKRQPGKYIYICSTTIVETKDRTIALISFLKKKAAEITKW